MCHFILNTDKEENLLRCLTDISSRFFFCMVEVLELNKSLILYSDSTFVLRLRLLQDLFFLS